VNFTELETILLMAIPVLLWRISVLRHELEDSEHDLDKCVQCLIGIGKGDGTVVQKDDGTWAYKPNGTNQ